MKTLTMTAGALIAAILAGCGSSPPPELKTARSTYQEVAQSQAASVAAADVYEAKKSLERAEIAFQDDGDSAETRDLAYIAERKAIIARARANTVLAATQKQVALAELDRWKQEHAQAMRERLGEANKELAQSQAQLESERQARVAAEQKTADALIAIKGLKAKQEARGLVLTLSGSVLFATGKSTLLPTAQKRLEEVAAALKADSRPITIVGHTDSVGSDEANQQLSQKRAEAVRNYMTAHGVPEDRVQAQGMGEAEPIADNKSAEGRANNRRVEIILQGSAAGPSAPGMGTQPGGSQKGKQQGTQPGGVQQGGVQQGGMQQGGSSMPGSGTGSGTMQGGKDAGVQQRPGDMPPSGRQ